MSRRILVIEDQQDIARIAALHLRDIGADVDLAFDGDAGWKAAKQGSYDLVVLDIMLPGVDGLEICRRLRAESINSPILMLTAKSAEMDRVLGLEVGADDYLTKPFSVRELQARAKAIFRRMDTLKNSDSVDDASSRQITMPNINIDPDTRVVKIHDVNVELTAREFDLLFYFALHPGFVFTRAQLLDAVWGSGHEGYEHTVNSHINRLRAKIEKDSSQPEFIQTVWGVGYRFTG